MKRYLPFAVPVSAVTIGAMACLGYFGAPWWTLPAVYTVGVCILVVGGNAHLRETARTGDEERT